MSGCWCLRVLVGARYCQCMDLGPCICIHVSNKVIWFDGYDRESDVDIDFSTDDDSRLC